MTNAPSQLDGRLEAVLGWGGGWIYVVLFLVIFCETGLVVTPFLPGDVLLFAVGAAAARYPDRLSLVALLALLTTAAILGDAANYAIGRRLGARLISRRSRFLDRDSLLKTQAFYDRHGAKTIVLARFLPIVRTFAPFVAGVAAMNYRLFTTYNVIGGAVWIILCTVAGYCFGNVPLVKENFDRVLVALVLALLAPLIGRRLLRRRQTVDPVESA